jgi:ornithine carbamoyltransferase
MGTALNLDQFRTAFRSGGLRSVSVHAAGGEFFIAAEPRTGERVTLATTHGGKLRAFRDPGKAIAVLHGIGVHKVGVDTSAWSPSQANLLARRRPDTAARQRRAHEAATHDAWFRSEVEQALREADEQATTQWSSQGEAKRQSARRREKWLAKAGTEKAEG